MVQYATNQPVQQAAAPQVPGQQQVILHLSLVWEFLFSSCSPSPARHYLQLSQIPVDMALGNLRLIPRLTESTGSTMLYRRLAGILLRLPHKLTISRTNTLMAISTRYATIHSPGTPPFFLLEQSRRRIQLPSRDTTLPALTTSGPTPNKLLQHLLHKQQRRRLLYQP